MPRIAPVQQADAQPAAQALLDGVKKSIGVVPNLYQTIAHSPAALNAYLGFSKALSEGKLSAAQREQIALAVAGENNCDYCASAHTLIGKGAGVAEDELAANLSGTSSDQRTQAVLTFAKEVVAKRGFVSDADLQAVRAAGLDEEEIVEVITVVVLNIFTNYFNHIAETEIDFPHVSAGEEAARKAA